MTVPTDKDKQVRISPGTYKQLSKIADQHEVGIKEMIQLMVVYFQVTKANAKEPQGDLPGLNIKKLAEKVDSLDKRFIGFIREQEKELLKPILSEVKATRSQLGTANQSADLAEQLQEVIFLMFGQAFNRSLLTNEYIEEFKRRIA